MSNINLSNILKKSAKTSIFVGTVLTIINQSEALFNAHFSIKIYIKIFLNYLVPFLVSSYSRYSLLSEITGGKNE